MCSEKPRKRGPSPKHRRWFRSVQQTDALRQIVLGGERSGKTTWGAIWLNDQIKRAPTGRFVVFGHDKVWQNVVWATGGTYVPVKKIVVVKDAVVHLNQVPAFPVDAYWVDAPKGQKEDLIVGYWAMMEPSQARGLLTVSAWSRHLGSLVEKGVVVGGLRTNEYPSSKKRVIVERMRRDKERLPAWVFRRRYLGELAEPTFWERVVHTTKTLLGTRDY